MIAELCRGSLWVTMGHNFRQRNRRILNRGGHTVLLPRDELSFFRSLVVVSKGSIDYD